MKNHIKKFTNIKTVEDINIKSDIGYVPIKNIMKTVEYDVYRITFTIDNGEFDIDVADFHIFINYDNKEIYAIDLNIGEKIIYDGGVCLVKSITNMNKKEQMYDIQMAYHHKYFTNGVLSHNTTIASAYVLHQSIFNMEYTTALLSYKKMLAVEILDRVRLMYEELPYFLQMGVSVWNRGNIELGNRSKIFTAPATTSAIRGRSVNCVDVNTIVTVKNKKNGKVESLTITELEKKIGLSNIS